MNRLEAITEAYLLCTSKTTLPAIGTAKRNQLTALARKFYRDWQTEPDTEWQSLYQDITAGTVSATDTFELDTEINFISKQDGNYINIDGTDFTAVKPQQLYQYRYANAVAKVADNSIKFSKPFTADSPLLGKTINVPAIIKLDDITSDTSEILIDNPSWLPARIAAQYAYSYKSLRDMYDDLLAIANEHMISMKNANTSGNESYNTGVNYFPIGYDL